VITAVAQRIDAAFARETRMICGTVISVARGLQAESEGVRREHSSLAVARARR